MKPPWDYMVQDLKGRGLVGVDLVVSDDYKGLKNRVRDIFKGFDGNDARSIFFGIFWVMLRPPNEGLWHWLWDACFGSMQKKKPEPSRTRSLTPLIGLDLVGLFL